jgi:hypothetical protein
MGFQFRRTPENSQVSWNDEFFWAKNRTKEVHSSPQSSWSQNILLEWFWTNKEGHSIARKNKTARRF